MEAKGDLSVYTFLISFFFLLSFATSRYEAATKNMFKRTNEPKSRNMKRSCFLEINLFLFIYCLSIFWRRRNIVPEFACDDDGTRIDINSHAGVSKCSSRDFPFSTENYHFSIISESGNSSGCRAVTFQNDEGDEKNKSISKRGN